MLENERVLISFKMSKMWIKKSAPKMILLDFKFFFERFRYSNKMLAMLGYVANETHCMYVLQCEEKVDFTVLFVS